jgi:epoxyqueuosine reductase
VAAELEVVDIACLAPVFFDDTGLMQAFSNWLAVGNGECLPYMSRNLKMRVSPFASRPWCKSALVVVFRNSWDVSESTISGLPAPLSPERPAARIAAYAAGPDYHQTGMIMLKRLARSLVDGDWAHSDTRWEPAVDSAPVPDSFMAIAAGLGCRGLNGLLRTSQFGSRVFVATLFSDCELPSLIRRPPASMPACADCRRCIASCPTGALDENRPINVARCRSFLSIEYRGVLDTSQQALLGDALFGCDRCTSACPPPSSMDSSQSIDLEQLLTMPTNQLKKAIAGTALTRAGATLLKRNAIANIANSPHPDAGSIIRRIRETTNSEVVAKTAAIAESRLS